MIKREENVYEIEIGDIRKLFKERDRDSHKGMFGTVGIMGGSIKYSGAIKLSSMSSSAMRGGCGIVRVIVSDVIAPDVSSFLLEETLFPIKCNDLGYMEFNDKEIVRAISNLKALAIGMGWEDNVNNQIILNKLLDIYSNALLIDADGLNILSKMNLNKLRNTKCKIILTPHLKEFERISHISINEIKENPIEVARKFAKEYSIILLLKGSTTIITDGEVTYLVKRGCPGMATAGSGDVLSGIIVGMLGYQEANLLTVAGAAYLAGIAGEMAQKEYTDISMIASDTVKYIPKAIKYIRNSC